MRIEKRHQAGFVNQDDLFYQDRLGTRLLTGEGGAAEPSEAEERRLLVVVVDVSNGHHGHLPPAALCDLLRRRRRRFVRQPTLAVFGSVLRSIW